MGDTLKNRIYNQILEGIIKKSYPLDLILKEKELAEQFKVSKAPVREALNELCKENIVKSIPRAGYRILQYTEKDIREATELRLILELSVLDRIIPLPEESRETFLETQRLVEESSYAKRNITVPLDIWWNNNCRFHLTLSAIGGNGLLSSTLESVIHREWRGIAQLFWSGDPNDYLSFEPGNHGELLQSIGEGDKKKAKRILTRDILSIRKFSP